MCVMFRAKFQAMFWITLHLALFDFTCLGSGDGLVRDRFKVRLKHLTYIGWFWQASTEILASVHHCLRKPGGGRSHMLVSKIKPRIDKHNAMQWFILLPWLMWHCCCLLLLPCCRCLLLPRCCPAAACCLLLPCRCAERVELANLRGRNKRGAP